MRHTTFTSPLLVMYSIFTPTIVLLIPLIISCVSLRVSNIIIIISVHLIMNALLSLFLNHAFVLVSYAQHGITTRHLNLRFDDINYATTIDVELLKYSLLPTITIKLICVSKEKIDCSFWDYNKRKCILLPITPKTIDNLTEYSGKRSLALYNLLSSL